MYNVGMIRVYRLYKCYLSGDDLHGSGSQINHVECHRTCVIHYYPDPLGSLHTHYINTIKHIHTHMHTYTLKTMNTPTHFLEVVGFECYSKVKMI